MVFSRRKGMDVISILREKQNIAKQKPWERIHLPTINRDMLTDSQRALYEGRQEIMRLCKTTLVRKRNAIVGEILPRPGNRSAGSLDVGTDNLVCIAGGEDCTEGPPFSRCEQCKLGVV